MEILVKILLIIVILSLVLGFYTLLSWIIMLGLNEVFEAGILITFNKCIFAGVLLYIVFAMFGNTVTVRKHK